MALYAKGASFTIDVDEVGVEGLGIWMDAFSGGGEVLGKVGRLMMSRVWKAERPERGVGWMGFYVELTFCSVFDSYSRSGSDYGLGSKTVGDVVVKTGTYPLANDTRGMRLESVNLLRDMIQTYLLRRRRSDGGGSGGLRRADVEFAVQAMGVVARHPIPAFDLEQSEQGRRARRWVWEGMEGELRELLGEGEGGDRGEGGRREGNGMVTEGGSVFFTPY